MTTNPLTPKQKGPIEKALARGKKRRAPPVLFTDCVKPNLAFMAACAESGVYVIQTSPASPARGAQP